MRDNKTCELLRSSEQKRDVLWQRAHASRGVLGELGMSAADPVGPWSGVGDVTGFAVEFLGAYAKKERVPWRREVLGGSGAGGERV